VVSDNELKQIMPTLSAAKRALYLPHLQSAMTRFKIDTYLREAAFLAQIAHESGEFKFLKELWGPTPAQKRYEKPNAMAHTLGNTQVGDGKRFMGRGAIQLTGRSNYRQASHGLGLASDPARDLERNPTLAETPEYAFLVSGWYWDTRHINAAADAKDFRLVTKLINPGMLHHDRRVAYYDRALLVLDQHEPAPAVGPTLFVNGVNLTATAKPYLLGGRMYAALKPIAAKLSLKILTAAGTTAEVQDSVGLITTLPFVIKNGTGIVAVGDVPGELTWDPNTLTATLTSV
jgi:predicted chitinase